MKPGEDEPVNQLLLALARALAQSCSASTALQIQLGQLVEFCRAPYTRSHQAYSSRNVRGSGLSCPSPHMISFRGSERGQATVRIQDDQNKTSL